MCATAGRLAGYESQQQAVQQHRQEQQQMALGRSRSSRGHSFVGAAAMQDTTAAVAGVDRNAAAAKAG